MDGKHAFLCIVSNPSLDKVTSSSSYIVESSPLSGAIVVSADVVVGEVEDCRGISSSCWTILAYRTATE